MIYVTLQVNLIFLKSKKKMLKNKIEDLRILDLISLTNQTT
jgi:hypothetical protein